MQSARLAYVMLRVCDLDRSLAFYTGALGMTLFRRQEYPEGKFTLAFVGYGGEHSASTIELTYNWGDYSYELGTGFGHIAIAVDDVHRATADLAAAGASILRAAGPMKHGTEVIAFVCDPDGYKIELVEG